MIKNQMSNKSLGVAFIFLLIISIASSCSMLDIEDGISKSVENKIKDFNNSSICNDANVKEYIFQDKIVYLFDSGICGADLSSEVIDSDSNSLGFLGGISGNTQINNEDFSNAVFIRFVWEK